MSSDDDEVQLVVLWEVLLLKQGPVYEPRFESPPGHPTALRGSMEYRARFWIAIYIRPVVPPRRRGEVLVPTAVLVKEDIVERARGLSPFRELPVQVVNCAHRPSRYKFEMYFCVPHHGRGHHCRERHRRR